MKYLKIIIIHIFSASLALASPNKVRKTTVAIDELITIKASVGIATFIQLPEVVQKSVVGDSAAFRIEFLGNEITLKPLRYGAKTNLYIITKERRYNFRLITVNQDQADYVVYVQPRILKTPNSVIWREYRRKAENQNLTFLTKRLGKTKDGFLLLDFELKSKVDTKIEVSNFWIYQGQEKKEIHTLFLSNLKASKDKPITGTASIAMNDLLSQVAGSFELRLSSKEILKIELPREILWKR